MMEHGWRPLFRNDQSARTRLHAALFTSYDRPDERFLAERLLPELLGIDPTFEGEQRERAMFYGRLATRLEELRGRIAVVSSVPQASATAARAYPWLWRYVHQLHVGRHAAAIQHAKLWLLHWKGGESESLEIVVSSANLTGSAARDQIQACCRIVVEVGPASAQLSSWGVFPDFLASLFASVGGGHELLAHFRSLLARCACPEGVTFLASVPGTHASTTLRRTPWGSAGLKQIVPAGGATRIRITAPYVGSWDERQLQGFCGAMEASPAALELLWIDRHHPWAKQDEGAVWRLPADTLQGLRRAKATLLRLDPDTRIHREHRGQNDVRWSHAKLYHLRRGRNERLIITSANFSRAAWGDLQGSSLHIRNFELGVCLDQAAWPLDELEPFENLNDVCTVEAEALAAECAIQWADATWDGETVRVRCRVSEGVRPMLEVCSADDARVSTEHWSLEQDMLIASIPWRGLDPPVLAIVRVDDEHRELGILDLRQLAQFQQSPLPEVALEDAEGLREQLLLEEFGHAPLEGDAPLRSQTEPNLSSGDDGDEPLSADYGVELFGRARRLFESVDAWQQRVEQAATSRDGLGARDYLLTRGEALLKLLRARAGSESASSAGLPARLCAEELAWRIEAYRSARGGCDV